MTGFSAKTFGLKNRGELREDFFADVTIFDEDNVLDAADFECPTRPAKGIECVLVNGRAVWENGTATGNRPGRALRHGS